MKVLVIQQKMIGDVLTSSILCEAVKQKHPSAELHYLINSHTVPVVENNPFIDHLVIYSPEIEKSIFRFFKFLQQIKAEKYDIVIDVYSKPLSVLIGNSTKAKIIIGYKKWYSQIAYTHLFSYKTKPDTSAGLAIENRMLLLQALDKGYPELLKPKIYLKEEEKITTDKILMDAGLKEKPLFMIGVLGSSEEKSYPLPYLAKVLDHIVEETGANLLFNYIPKQLPQVQKLLEFCSEKTKKNTHLEIYGKSLREFMALTYHCNAFIGNEGGAVNMAKALSVPTFSIFAPFTKKAAWALFEDEKNVSVHLADYQPQAYEKLNLKDIRKEASDYYEKFTPDFFKEKLNQFLKLTLL